MDEVTVIAAHDSDFAWFAGQAPPTRPLRVAPEIAPPEVLEVVRGLHANWLIVASDKVVGLVGIKSEPTDGEAEIAYGIAPLRQRRGLASAAVRALLALLKRDGELSAITAECGIDNVGSRRVLEQNGFARVGERIDEEDGPLLIWRRPL